MSDRPRLLDLFSGAGGAAMGYHRAGFEVVGVDLVNQPNYPFEFHQADVMVQFDDGIYEAGFGEFDAIHASPPCQRYIRSGNVDRDKHSDLLRPYPRTARVHQVAVGDRERTGCSDTCRRRAVRVDVRVECAPAPLV